MVHSLELLSSQIEMCALCMDYIKITQPSLPSDVPE